MSRRKKYPAKDVAAAVPEMADDTSRSVPDRERIAQRAYQLYLERGGADGYAEEDWLRAERELSVAGSRSES